MFKKSLAGLLVVSVGLLVSLQSTLLPAHAQESGKLPESALQLLPADTAFFDISLKLKEQCDRITKSKAWAKLLDLGVSKIVKAKVDEAIEGLKANDDQFEKKQAQVMTALKVLGKLASHEVVVAGGPNTPASLGTLMDVANSSRFAPLNELLQGNFKSDPKEKSLAQIKAMIETLSNDSGKLQAPEILIGFKLNGDKIGTEILAKIEKNLPALEKTPLKGKAKKEAIAGSDFITLRLKGTDFPTDKINIPDLDDELEKKLIAKVKNLTFVLAIGIHKDYLIVSMGPDDKYLASLGKGKSVASLKEVQVLAKHHGKNITGMSYVSEKFISSLQGSSADLSSVGKDLIGELKAANLPRELSDRISKDLQELIKESIQFTQKTGAVVGVGFATKDGAEMYSYNFNANPYQDSSKPLGILENMGGNPILAFAGRLKCDGTTGRFLAKWFKISYGYLKDFGVPNIPGDDREKVEAFLKKAEPIVESIAKTTENLLAPALKDGQIGFALDAKLSSKQWSPMMPKSKTDLPILEPAFLLGLSDSQKLVQAFGEYRVSLNKLIKAGAEFDPTGTLSTLKIDPPTIKDVNGAKYYHYPIPDLGLVDNRIQPGAVVSKDFLALVLSVEHAERLLKKSSLTAQAAKDAGQGKNASGFSIYDNQEFLKFLGAWVGFGLDQMPAGLDEALGIRSQVKTTLQILGTCKGVGAISFEEDGATVTRIISLWKDLD